MQTKQEQKATFIRYATRCGFIILALLVTPFLALPVAKLFDWAVFEWSKNGELRDFYTYLFTALFWVLEGVGFYFLDKYVLQKKVTSAETTDGEPQEQSQDVAEGKAQKKKEQAPLLPCILLISVQIGFEVKPFYELGEKTTRSEIMNKVGEILCNGVKSALIVAFLRAGLALGQAIVKEDATETQKTWLPWLVAGVLMLVFGLCDVLLTANPFAWTYMVFYVAFTAIYFFTERSVGKSYGLIFFLYIF